MKLSWQLAKHQMSYARAYETAVAEESGGVRIENTMSVGGMTTRPPVRMETVWTVAPSGAVTLEMDGKIDTNFGMLPRFGIRMFLPEAMDQVTYFGMGPMESYVDKRRASWHGRFSANVADLHEDYLRPQENGSHYDCDFVTLTGGGLTLSAASESAFSFNASCYTQEELTDKAHSYELVPSGHTVLCLDYAQNGIGSNSCGPALDKQYALPPGDFTFKLHLIPGVVQP